MSQESKTLLLLFSAFLVLFIGIAFYFYKLNDLTDKKYLDFYYVGDKVPFAQCKVFFRHECGLLLESCTNGKTYSCINHVWFRDSR